MRAVKEPESWVVYQSVDGPRMGMKSVCEASEWEVLQTSQSTAVKLIKKNKHGEFAVDWLALRIPLLGKILQKGITARVCRTLPTSSESRASSEERV